MTLTINEWSSYFFGNNFASLLIYFSINRFDTVDLAMAIQAGCDELIESVILYNIGRVLGISSTMWEANGLLDENNDYRENTSASAVWKNEWGCVGTPPVEKDPGIALDGWDEECLLNEVMTVYPNFDGVLLSKLTIAGLEDIGYAVDYDMADAYDGSDTTCCLTGATPVATQGGETSALSEEGIAAATAYGQSILNERKHFFADDHMESQPLATGLRYVGDHALVVFYVENGRVHEVFVKSNR